MAPTFTTETKSTKRALTLEAELPPQKKWVHFILHEADTASPSSPTEDKDTKIKDDEGDSAIIEAFSQKAHQERQKPKEARGVDMLLKAAVTGDAVKRDDELRARQLREGKKARKGRGCWTGAEIREMQWVLR